jgi:hypothetical protein
MTKKFKIKDLEAEADRDSRTRQDFTRLSLDDLTDDESVVPMLENPSAPTQEPDASKLKAEVAAKPQSEINVKVITRPEVTKEQVSFKRNHFFTYLFKVLSFAIILICLDLSVHFLKILENVDVLKLENFDSILYGMDMKWNVIKLCAFLTGIYLMTSDDKLVLNNYGIECRSISVTNMFFTSSKVLLRWEEIVAVEYKVRLFEPHLFFYGMNKEKLGQIDFNLESPKDFFQFVEKNAGKNHPLFKIQRELSSI